MFVDSSGALGIQHAQDLRRAGRAHRLARIVGTATPHEHLFRAFVARGQLGPTDNYRAR